MVIIIAVMKSAWFKGLLGEFIVNAFIRIQLDKHKYHLIKNVTLPTDDGSTQIDHIIVSEYGVFVIETKNMKGWIFGSERQKQWTQKLFKHVNKFQNPLHQNYKHIKVLASCIGIDESKLFSVIAFVGDSTFKTTMPDNVTNASGVVRHIKSKTDLILSPSEVSDVALKIKAGRLTPSIKVHKAHIEHVKQIKQRKSLGQTCPKCGSNMVIRTAKQGENAGNQFWGCTQFPKCRSIISC